MRRLAATCLVAALGCGDDGGKPNSADAQGVDVPVDAFVAGPNDGAHSGTRLKLRWYVFADGARHLAKIASEYFDPNVGLHDAVLGVDCVMERWVDGNDYCTPSHSKTAAYADSLCTQPVIAGEATCGGPPGYAALQGDIAGCGSTVTKGISKLFKVAALAPGSHAYMRVSGICMDLGVSAYPLYGATEEVLSSALAQITTTEPLGDDPLEARYHQSADGFQMQADELTDRSTGIECIPEDFFSEGRATARCGRYLPNFRAGYAEAGCTTAVTTASACLSPTTVFMESDICPYNQDPADKFWRLGAQQITLSTTTCGTSPGTYQTLEPLTLPQMTRTRDASEGHRIQPIRDSSDSFSRVDREFMYDSALDTECQIVGTQCWPIHLYVRPTRYSDDMCTQPLDVQDHYTGGCNAPLSKYAIKQGNCAQITEIALVGALYTGPIYERNLSNVCVPTTTGTYYSLGTWQSGSTVATAVIENDP